MRRSSTVVLSLAMASLLFGCTNMSNQDAGLASGAVIGGLMGSQFGRGGGQVLATGAGMMAGALIGASIGKNMDDNDRSRLGSTLENNQVGQPAYWQNQRTGNSYTVVPVRDVSLSGNPYCREYRTTANIGGKTRQLYGTACRQPDGSWQIQPPPA